MTKSLGTIMWEAINEHDLDAVGAQYSRTIDDAKPQNGVRRMTEPTNETLEYLMDQLIDAKRILATHQRWCQENQAKVDVLEALIVKVRNEGAN